MKKAKAPPETPINTYPMRINPDTKSGIVLLFKRNKI
jgi:hypothetical protein